jgi:hypothetical protein
MEDALCRPMWGCHRGSLDLEGHINNMSSAHWGSLQSPPPGETAVFQRLLWPTGCRPGQAQVPSGKARFFPGARPGLRLRQQSR